MIVVLYRWTVSDEPTFRAAWAETTELLRARGSGGSALFAEAEGTLAALAIWPDAATRAAAFAGLDRPDLTARMAGAAQRIEERVLHAIDNRWAAGAVEWARA